MQEQAGALVVGAGVEGEHSVRAALARPRHGGLDVDRAAHALAAVDQAECVQALQVGPRALLEAGHEIDGLGGRVDHRRREDADELGDVVVAAVVLDADLADVGHRDRGEPGAARGVVLLPDGGSGAVVGVEGVDAALHGDDEDHVALAAGAEVEPGYIEDLTVDLVVDVAAVELAEGGRADGARFEHGLEEIGARALENRCFG